MRKVWFADFETTQPDENNRVEVYLWAIVSGRKVSTGFNIETFIEWCKTKKAILYFHNLKFDFSYIQYYLIKNNIKYKLLEKKGCIYSARFFDVELRDSLNFMPMTLKEVGENYCQQFKKTSIDYNVEVGHIASEEEIKYCINDCQVLEEGLTNYLSTLEEILEKAGAFKSAQKVFKKLTNAGISFEAFKELSDFNACCPKTTKSEYNLYKQAYRGGFVYSNPKGIVEDVMMIDCNSMYPFMYSTIEMPFGNGIIVKDLESLNRYKFYIIKLYIKYELKDGYIPIIGGGIGKYGNTEYKSSSDGEYEELTISNKDFELIKEFYEIDFTFLWGVGWHTKPQFFKKYADTFISVKNANKGIKRAVAKVLLNSPYGKTAMNGLNEIKTYKIDEKTKSVKSEVIGYEVDDNVFQYLPIAIAITSSARYYLLTTALKIGFENVYYMDTDSIKFKNKETGIKYDPDILGAWKNEGHCKLFKTISPKKYVYWGVDGDDTIHYTCAGFNKSVLSEEMYHCKNVTKDFAIELMNMFDKGLELSCLQSKLVEGGRALIPVKKQIK